jgi:hypothetical protein
MLPTEIHQNLTIKRATFVLAENPPSTKAKQELFLFNF